MKRNEKSGKARNGNINWWVAYSRINDDHKWKTNYFHWKKGCLLCHWWMRCGLRDLPIADLQSFNINKKDTAASLREIQLNQQLFSKFWVSSLQAYNLSRTKTIYGPHIKDWKLNASTSMWLNWIRSHKYAHAQLQEIQFLRLLILSNNTSI